VTGWSDTTPRSRASADRGPPRESLARVTSSGTRAEREAWQRGRSDVPGAPLPRTRPPSGSSVGRPPGPRTAAGPLVARRELVVPSRHPAPLPGGWFRRFVRRHGWRAYAIPLLTIATVLTLIDLAGTMTDGRAGQPAAVEAPTPTAAGTPTAASAPAEGEGAPTRTAAQSAVPALVEQGAGTVSVVDGTSPVYGTGPLERFVVEVEDGIGVDGAEFAGAVETTLGDPRSWGHGGQLSFQRVGAAEATAGDYDFRVTLVSPGNMEIYCPGVGTGGYTSCRYGERAVINLARWETAVPDYAGDLATYRLYVVNHEVGHALGHGHEQCAGAGQLAPVMEQQTLGLQGCVKNAWPYPV
jgi:hypothetical protein